MSSPSAIAAVTSALVNVIENAAGDKVTIHTVPPDKFEPEGGGAHVNVYLFQLLPNAAFRNSGMPRMVSGADAPVLIPTLALNLHYLISIYSDKPRDAEVALGLVMSAINDQPVLDRALLQKMAAKNKFDAHLEHQPESVRLVLQPLSVDDIFKIWSGFHKPYRLSVAYEASVVLIDSGKEPRLAPPVIFRGGRDAGPSVVASVPRLDGIRFPIRARLPRGTLAPPVATVRAVDPEVPDELTLLGAGLDASRAIVQFRRLGSEDLLERRAEPNIDGLAVKLTWDPNPAATGPKLRDDVGQWRTGFYSVTVLLANPTDAQSLSRSQMPQSNALTFALSPTLADCKQPKVADGSVVIRCTISPALSEEQEAIGFVGDRSAGTATVVTSKAARGPRQDTLEFRFPHESDDKNKTAVLRIRVDGVESISVNPKMAADDRVSAFNPDHLVVLP